MSDGESNGAGVQRQRLTRKPLSQQRIAAHIPWGQRRHRAVHASYAVAKIRKALRSRPGL